ncbi:DUF1028 domain-containing protein [Oryzobacter telluris]|uniref:DUF1028 domain-containing protein n=1 Tax=Oryzobacter telluris TaxID=3149179 RepID=UPI00370D1496
MTFSIAAHDGDAWGVAVASKFVAVGSIVPAVRVGVGAVATQSLARWAYRNELLDALASGTDVQTALAAAAAADDGRALRQVGAVGGTGAATFTGDECFAWAGGRAAGDTETAYAVQGNILTGPEVVEAMEAAFLAHAGAALDERLLAALLAGDAAGGDSRGRQSAALLVHAPGAGYDACGVLADLRVDDHPHAPTELARLHALATLVFGGPEEVTPLGGALRAEVARHLAALGHAPEDQGPAVERALEAWMSAVNLENRHSPGGIDGRVLEELRSAARDLTDC